jgi:hypothetical protein
MSNELINGLFQSLLAPQQSGPAPADIMAAVNSRNPMASAMAINSPSMAQVTKGLLGQISGGRLSTATPQEYMQQAVAASPELLQTAAGMRQLAQMAQQAGDRPTALRLSLMSQEKAKEEAVLAQQQAKEGQQTMSIANLQNSVSQLAVQQGRPEIADAVKAIDDPAAIMKLAEPLYQKTGGLTQAQLGTMTRYFTGESVQAFSQNGQATSLVPRPATETEGGLTAYQDAQLYAKFTPESIQARRRNPESPLVPLPRAETGQLTDTALAGLYKDYTADSIQAFRADRNSPLIPLPTQGADRRSAHAQRLVEEGLAIGSPEFQTRMNEYNQNVAKINTRPLSALEQAAILNDDLRNSSTHKQTEEDIATLKRIQDTLPLLDGTNPQAFTVVTASIPMLYQTNARAASEIDSFRSRKSITSSIGDWVAKAAGDTATQETKDNLKELVATLDRSLTAQYAKEVDSVRRGYTGLVDQQILDTWYSNQLMDLTTDTEALVNGYLEY